MAVLDINPANKGHVLVLPKEHYPLAVLIPTKEFDYFIRKCKDICECTKKAMVNFGYTFFIANGYVAGQQSSHFLAHIVPSDACPSNFQIPKGRVDKKELEKNVAVIRQNLTGMMNNAFEQLGKKVKISDSKILEIIEMNPNIKTAILKNTEAFKKIIPTNPQLEKLFAGVDIDKLKEKLEKISKNKNTENKNHNEKQQEMVVFEDEDIIAILGDGNEGHVIVKAVKDVKSSEDLSSDIFAEMGFASLYSSMILFQLMKADGTNIILNDYGKGIEFNIFSRKENDGLNFLWIPQQLSKTELKKIADQIKDKCDMIGIVMPEKKIVDLDTEPEKIENNYRIKSLKRKP